MDSRFQAYLDRFEGGLAVLLVDGTEILVPARLLPEDAREGDHLQVSLTIDAESREKTAGEVSEMQERLESGDKET